MDHCDLAPNVSDRYIDELYSRAQRRVKTRTFRHSASNLPGDALSQVTQNQERRDHRWDAPTPDTQRTSRDRANPTTGDCDNTRRGRYLPSTCLMALEYVELR